MICPFSPLDPRTRWYPTYQWSAKWEAISKEEWKAAPKTRLQQVVVYFDDILVRDLLVNRKSLDGHLVHAAMKKCYVT